MNEQLVSLERIAGVGARFLNGFAIGGSVGDWSRGATNTPDDVKTVQILLEFAAKREMNPAFDPGGVDGKISRTVGRSGTVRAIKAFQRGFFRNPDGLVEPDGTTHGKLRDAVSGSEPRKRDATHSVMKVPAPGEGKPGWLKGAEAAGSAMKNAISLLPTGGAAKPKWISVAEAELGVKEITGKKHNARVLEYHWSTDQLKDKKKMTDERPWCASFVGWVLEQAGYASAESSWSHAYKRWGEGISKPAVGAVAVIDWGKVYPGNEDKQGKGHVGFVVGKTASGRIVLLGGNQDNRVKYSAYRKSAIDRYRIPKGFELSADAYDLPVMKITGGGTGFDATR